MKLIETKLQGVYIIENFVAEDNRGSFVKTFHEGFFKSHDLCTDFKESYFSISKKDIIRGMHFQLPPDDHEKLVYVISGGIEDVMLDLRSASPTYGSYQKVVLNSDNRRSVYIPKGLAHGYKSLVEGTVVVYQVSTVYKAVADYGIRYDSFGCDWQLTAPVISERDRGFKLFKAFEAENPF